MNKLLIFVLVLCTWGVLAAEEKVINKEKNVCYTDNVDVKKGASFSVGVYVDNLDTLAGMQVPIYYRSEDIDIKWDSVSFIDSRCGHFGFSDAKIEPVGKTVYFAFIYMIDPNKEVEPLLPGKGLVATLWFTAAKEAETGKLTLDSGPNAYLPNPKIDYGYHFWTPAAVEVDFEFKPGTITVK